MKEAILIIIGALISCGTTWFLDFIKSSREEKIHYKRKKEETYIEMEDLITDYCAHLNEIKETKRIDTSLRKKYNNIRTKAHLYAKKEIADDFYELLSKIMYATNSIYDIDMNKWDKLTRNIKQDLGIKD